jgi:hypothetical protein
MMLGGISLFLTSGVDACGAYVPLLGLSASLWASAGHYRALEARRLSIRPAPGRLLESTSP